MLNLGHHEERSWYDRTSGRLSELYRSARTDIRHNQTPLADSQRACSVSYKYCRKYQNRQTTDLHVPIQILVVQSLEHVQLLCLLAFSPTDCCRKPFLFFQWDTLAERRSLCISSQKEYAWWCHIPFLKPFLRRWYRGCSPPIPLYCVF